MKKLFILISLTFGLTFTGFTQTSAYYQDKNILSSEDFYNISFNGITLQNIIATKGDPVKVNTLFGTHMKTNKSDDPNYYWINFWNDDVSFTFDESSTSPAALSNFEVDGKQVAVKIGNKIIHFGDSIDKLGSVKQFTQKDGIKTILFITKNSDGVWLSIDFDPTTRTITKITYMAT